MSLEFSSSDYTISKEKFNSFIDRDAQHNVSYSEISKTVTGAIIYSSVGEVSPILSLESNRITNNCRQLYGNFSTCEAAINIDVQNMQSFFFVVSIIQNFLIF